MRSCNGNGLTASPRSTRVRCCQAFGDCAALLLALSCALVGCGPSGHNTPVLPPRIGVVDKQVEPSTVGGIRFEDNGIAAGIGYVFPKQPRPMRNLEAFGSGCAVFDYDGDGWMDILLVARPHPILYHNRGDGTFEETTVAAGLDKLTCSWWTGVAAGDFNGDGRMDLALTGYRRLALLKNLDGKQFVEVTRQAGLDPYDHNLWGSSAGFMDLEGNGKLDLIVLHYVVFGPKEPQYCELIPGIRTGCPPSQYHPEFGQLWQNLGDGRFRDITSSSGIGKTHGKALVVAFADVDDDGKIDFYIGNDGTPAELMHNLGGHRFTNIGQISGASAMETGHAIAAMGADWADYDRDGRPDLTVTAFANEPYLLFHNMGGNQFEHTEVITGISGPTLKPLGFGAKWLDVDNDGWPDILYTNGHVYDNSEMIDPMQRFLEPLMLFHNVADKYEEHGRQFLEIVPQLGGDIGRPMLGRGLASGDFDNDGRIDVLAIDFEGRPSLLHNLSSTANHWVTLDIRENGPNRFAYGAKVTVRTGADRWIAYVSPSSSYLSSSDPRIHFGLGSAGHIDDITVRWPDGSTDSYGPAKCDSFLLIQRGKGVSPAPIKRQNSVPMPY